MSACEEGKQGARRLEPNLGLGCEIRGLKRLPLHFNIGLKVLVCGLNVGMSGRRCAGAAAVADFVQRARFDEGAARIDHGVLLDLALECDTVASDVALPWLGRFVRRHQGRLAHEAAALPPGGFLLPRALTDLLPGRLGAIVPLLARAGDEALRALVGGFAAEGSRPRVIDGAVPVVLAAALRRAP